MTGRGAARRATAASPDSTGAGTVAHVRMICFGQPLLFLGTHARLAAIVVGAGVLRAVSVVLGSVVVEVIAEAHGIHEAGIDFPWAGRSGGRSSTCCTCSSG